MARTSLLKDAFPSGVGLGGDKVIERFKLEQTEAGPLSRMRRWCTPDSHFTVIDPKTVVHAVIDWNEETINFPPGTLAKRPHRLVRLRVSADDLEAWLKQIRAPAAKPKRTHTTSENRNAEIRRKIEMVLEHRKHWPRSKRRLDEHQQAHLLYDELKASGGYGTEVIRQIIRGTYPPMVRRGIAKPKPG
jgi:hypothetical protein